MKYSINYMLTRDIDWFCIINGRCVHIASAGGLLPDRINDRDSLREIQHLVSTSENIYSPEEITYNEQFLSNRFAEKYEEREKYLSTFREMALKGFISLDRTNWNNPDDNTYHIVCRPTQIEKCVFDNYSFLESWDIEHDIMSWEYMNLSDLLQ